MNPLEISGLTKHYPKFSLTDVDLSVPRGYVMGLVGANGAGKTTTIKCALGMVLPNAGSISMLPKEQIGVVMDTIPYPPEWTSLTVSRTLSGFFPSWDENVFAQQLSAAAIRPETKVKELSRGMGVRLQLAVALSHGAEFLILDEPTSGLDPFARDEFVTMISEFMTDENHSVLFSTHITTDLEKVADLVTVMTAGRVVSSSTKDDLLDGYRMIKGRPEQLSPELRSVCIGLREHSVGWDALVETQETASLPAGLVIEAPTLEEIIIRNAKESRNGQ